MIGQLCLIGDCVLVALLILKIVGNILKNLLVIAGLTFLIMMVIYGISSYEKGMETKIMYQIKEFIENMFGKHITPKGYWA